MSVMRIPPFRILENKDSDQLYGNPVVDHHLCFHYIYSTIPLFPKSKILSLYNHLLCFDATPLKWSNSFWDYPCIVSNRLTIYSIVGPNLIIHRDNVIMSTEVSASATLSGILKPLLDKTIIMICQEQNMIGLCLTWSKTLKTDFLVAQLKWNFVF